MKYRAVVFDLFDTLVDNALPEDFQRNGLQMASCLSAPGKGFVSLWRETFPERVRGVFGTIEESIEHVSRLLGLQSEPNSIAKAAEVRSELTRRQLTPRPGAVKALVQLRSAGHKIGLISNSTPEVPQLWQETAFAPLVDAAVFSCIEGLTKPDARIYRLACTRMAVAPGNCLFIGDGGSEELTGAARVGMHPVLVRVPNRPLSAGSEADSWQGPTITSLAEVLDLVGSEEKAMARPAKDPKANEIPASIEALIGDFQSGLGRMLGAKRVGLYLFGSVAFPGFEPHPPPARRAAAGALPR